MRATGVKFLQTPSTYIIAIITAFILYYVDSRYRLDLIVSQSKEELLNIKERMKSD